MHLTYPSKQHLACMLALEAERLQLLQRPCILSLIRGFLLIFSRFHFSPIALLPAGRVVIFTVEILGVDVVLA